MLLNMSVVRDYLPTQLPRCSIVEGWLGAGDEELHLTHGELWLPGEDVASRDDILYVCEPTQGLPPVPERGKRLSFVSTQKVPKAYRRRNCQFLEVSGCSGMALANAVARIFNMFDSWTARARGGDDAGDVEARLSKIDVSMLENMVFVLNPLGFVVHEFNPAQPADEDSQAPLEAVENAFVFNEHLARQALTEPKDVEVPDLKARALCVDLVRSNAEIGRLAIISNKRKLRQSDYVLIRELAEAVSAVMDEEFKTQGSWRFDTMLEHLVVEKMPWRGEFIETLATKGWGKNDDYICLAIAPDDDNFDAERCYQHRILFNRLFAQSYAFVREFRLARIDIAELTVVMNISKIPLRGETVSLLSSYLETHHLKCAISTVFTDFSEAAVYCKQASFLLNAVFKMNAPQRIYDIDDYAATLAFDAISKNMPIEAYFTTGMKRLIEIDRDDGQLLKTLRVFLESNCNATKAVNQLGIHRTTFYYRLNKIEEILELDLGNYHNRLYLMILIESLMH